MASLSDPVLAALLSLLLGLGALLAASALARAIALLRARRVLRSLYWSLVIAADRRGRSD